MVSQEFSPLDGFKSQSLTSKLGLGIVIVGSTLDMILMACDVCEGHRVLPPISEHIGNWTYIACSGYIPASVGALINLINEHNNNPSPYLVKCGKYLPKITTFLTVAYMSLGESYFPQLLSGTADTKDIPAIIVAGIATYVSVDVITNIGKIFNYEKK